MKNQYHKKDKQIKIVGRYTSQTPGGYPTARYKYLVDGFLWAYTRQLSQDQIFQAQAYGEAETRLFVLNHRTDLRLYYIIEYKGKYYTITRIDSEDDYNTELFVYVSDTKPGDTPRDGEIEPAGNDPIYPGGAIGVAEEVGTGVGVGVEAGTEVGYHGVHQTTRSKL